MVMSTILSSGVMASAWALPSGMAGRGWRGVTVRARHAPPPSFPLLSSLPHAVSHLGYLPRCDTPLGL